MQILQVKVQEALGSAGRSMEWEELKKKANGLNGAKRREAWVGLYQEYCT